MCFTDLSIFKYKKLSRTADLLDPALFISSDAQGGGQAVPVGGLLAGTKDEQIITVGLGFDLRFAVLDSRIFFIDLAADLIVNVFVHILPRSILTGSGGCASRRVSPEPPFLLPGVCGRISHSLALPERAVLPYPAGDQNDGCMPGRDR